MALTFDVTQSPTPRSDAERTTVLQNPGFGNHFTDHMVTVEWTKADGWHAARVTPYGPISMDPAAAVLHYAQEIFEGMKAYRHADGTVWTFRPDRNAARFARSATRMALPVMEEVDFVESVHPSRDASGTCRRVSPRMSERRAVPAPGDRRQQPFPVGGCFRTRPAER